MQINTYRDLLSIMWNNPDTYITLDVIEKNQPERLAFVDSVASFKKETKSDLINSMMEYQMIAAHLSLTRQYEPGVIDCPVLHCTFGFEHPRLKPFLKVFNKGAQEQKSLIIDTFNQDPDLESLG